MADTNPFAKLFRQPPFSTTLAILQPGTQSEPIRVSLSTVDPTACTYDCISYDRSGENQTVDIEVDGAALSIPVPLEQALRALRDHQPRNLFADLLVGSTSEERSARAAESKVVFENAHEVIAWIGPEDDQTAAAFEMMHALANEWQQASLISHFPESLARATQQQTYMQQQHLRNKSGSSLQCSNISLYNDIRDLFTARYFSSVQTIPDLLLAKNAKIVAGKHTISWPSFNAALRAYTMLVPDLILNEGARQAFLTAFTQISALNVAKRRKDHSESLELMPMIQDARDASYSDPREIVFSMLPIITPSKRTESEISRPEPPKADYAKSVADVFKEAARYIVHDRQDVLLWWTERPPCGRKIVGLPSWVPDWTATLPKSAIKVSPNNGLRGWADPLPDRRLLVDDEFGLHIHAHALDRVTSVSEIFTTSNCRRLCLREWLKLPTMPKESLDDRVQKVFRTLILNDAGIGMDMQSPLKPHRHLWHSFQSVLAEERILELVGCTAEEFMARPELVERAKSMPDCQLLGPQTGRSEPFAKLLERNTLGRRFFQTESGRTGMTAVEERADAALPPEDAAGVSDARHANFDTAMGDPMGQAMMQQFQSFMGERFPKQAEILDRALKGDLPGQASPGVRIGDLVVALVGGFQPYVLRPEQTPRPSPSDQDGSTTPLTETLEPESRYLYVGDCYLHGVMDGECFKTRNWLWQEQYRQDVKTVELVIV